MKKWYSLIDKVYRLENLKQAYRAVRANKGAPGVDGETVLAFGQRLEEKLDQLHYELKTGTYEPQPVKRVEILKVDGSYRPLGIPTVRDRVVQQALLNILQPIFEPGFHPSSYGYRPGRSCHKAVAKAEMFINTSIHPDKIKSFKKKIKKLTPRNHGMNVEEIVARLNPILRGWANYFKIANCKGIFAQLMEWIRRRLRIKKMREWKKWKQLHKALRKRGYKGEFLKISMSRWRNSASPLINMALPNSWFDELGLVNIASYKVGILYHFREE
jgi:hypothetical protein